MLSIWDFSFGDRISCAVDYCESDSPLTSAFRSLWRKATAVMPEDWCLRFAQVTQRDLFGMFKETQERKLGSLNTLSISDYILLRRAHGFVESSLVILVVF